MCKTIITEQHRWLLQLTWIPNEIEGFDFVLFESIERFMEPKGWLWKLWECLTPGGLAVLVGSSHWNAVNVGRYISKW